MTFFLVQVWLWERFGVSSQSHHWAGHHQLLHKIHFSRLDTIQSRKCSLLSCRIREGDSSKRWLFWFSVSSWGTHLSRSFTFPVSFKCQMTIEWSTLSSSAASHVIMRGPASMILLVGHCQLPMAGHYTPHVQDSHLLCKTSWTITALYIRYRFPGQMHCWCCELSLLLYDPFQTWIKKLLEFAFCLRSSLWSGINIKQTSSNKLLAKNKVINVH